MSPEKTLLDLPEPVLVAIFQHVEDADLINLRATHSILRKHIDPYCKLVFCRRWGLVGVLEAPRCAPYYLAARAPHFAWQHDLGPRDTLASVALRYHCDMVVLRRYNNLMSEAGVACRTQLYVPVSDLEQVRGCAAAFVRCQHVGRRFVVAFVPGKDPPRPLDPGTPPPASDKIIRMLERGLRIDRSTALYYLNSHSQSLRDAISAFEQDQAWRPPQRAWDRR